MKAISIYRNLLLPDITDFCQNFFPSLVEHSYDENKEPPHALQKEKINNCSSLFMLWLKNSLNFDEPPICTEIYFSLKNKSDMNEVERLNQYLTYATANKIDSQNNPLAPNNIISALAYYIQSTNHTKTIQLIEHLQNQFNEVAFGFYKKLNSLCDNYFKEAIDSYDYNNISNYKKPALPNTSLDDSIIENTYHTQQPLLEHASRAQDISHAERTIDTVKQLFKTNLTEENLHPSIYRATKKLYLPLINYAISTSPNNSTAVATKISEIIDDLAQFTPAASHQQAVQAQQIIYNFIQQALNQAADLTTLSVQLSELASTEMTQPKVQRPNPGNPPLNSSPTAHTKTQYPDIKNIEPQQYDAPSINTPSLTPLESECALDDNQSVATAHTSPPTIDTQKNAQDAITGKLKSVSQHTIAHQLHDDWKRVLIVTGNIHGIHSAQWQNCMNTFHQLTQFSTLKEVPLPLLYKIEAQLQFAGISTDELELTSAVIAPSHTTEVISIREGAWFEYVDTNEHITRCKLAAIIKQIGLYIFVTKHGKKVLEIPQDLLQTHLDSGTLTPLQTASLNNTLEDVLRNIKQAQNMEFEKSY